MSRVQAPVSRREMIQLIEDNINTLERIPDPHPDNLRILQIYIAISLKLRMEESPHA